MKLLNTAVGIARSRFLGSPFYVRFHVTHRCNYRCRMCRLHELGDAARELDLERIGVVADRLRDLGARHAVLTGGEPFVRPDLPAIVEAFASRGFSVRVQTNGGPLVTRPTLEACARAGLRDLSVSCDTLDRPTQDEICGGRDVVEHALGTLRLARELLPDGMTQANVVASAYNFRELPSLVKFFDRLGAYTYITPVMIAPKAPADGDPGYLFRSTDQSFRPERLPATLHEHVLDELVALRRAGRGLTNSTRYLEDYRRYLATGRCDWRCECGTLVLDVHPDGGVCVCKENPPVANVLDPGFLAFYRSGAFREAAAATAARCEGCFYGEYREPQYAVRDLAVFGEWVRDWVLTFRRGMRRPADPAPLPSPAPTAAAAPATLRRR